MSEICFYLHEQNNFIEKYMPSYQTITLPHTENSRLTLIFLEAFLFITMKS